MSTPPAGVGLPDRRLHLRHVEEIACPYCGQHFAWTSDIEMAREAEQKGSSFPIEYKLGIVVAGREPIILNVCKGPCKRPYVIKFENFKAENQERERTWWEEEGRYHPQNYFSKELREATPKRVFRRPQYVAITVSQFVRDVRNEHNRFIREAIVRRVEAAGWRVFPPGFLDLRPETPPEDVETSESSEEPAP